MKSNEWPIVICGPSADGFVYRDSKGRRYILSMTGKMYGFDQLRKWGKRLKGKPVYSSHDPELCEATNGQRSLSLTRLYNPTIQRPEKIGYVKHAAFDEQRRQITAMIRVTDEWNKSFMEALVNLTLNEIGFSAVWSVREVESLRVAPGVQFPTVEVMDVVGVDITDFPFFGGRFMGVKPNEYWLESARIWKLENTGRYRYERR